MAWKTWGLATLLLSTAACRTGNYQGSGLSGWFGFGRPSAEEEAQRQAFDRNAAPIQESPFDPAFCPGAEHFSIVNAYWLAMASTYAYAPAAQIEALKARIKEAWGKTIKVRRIEFIAGPSTDTQAFWLETNRFIVLAFRGTQISSVKDVLTDARAILQVSAGEAGTPGVDLGGLHKGFALALNEIWPQIHELIMSVKDDQVRTPIFLTGHSLGGALATIALHRIWTDERYVTFNGRPDLDRIRRRIGGLYTYGSPRAGNKVFAQQIIARTTAYRGDRAEVVFRVRNNNDVVTRIPYIRDYVHVQPTYYFDQNGRLYTNDNDRAVEPLFCAEDWWKGMAESVFSHDDDGTSAEDWATMFGNHSIKNYVQHFARYYEDLLARVGPQGNICAAPPARHRQDAAVAGQGAYCSLSAVGSGR